MLEKSLVAVIEETKEKNMKQDLGKLTKEDWNRFFPIELVPYNPSWSELYEREKQQIIDKLEDKAVLRIEHFGSTSIPGILAKPYIDILIEIPHELLFTDKLIDGLNSLGYHYFRPTGSAADYMVFVKGYNVEGEKEQIYHIHMCPKKNEMWEQVKFRDYLIANSGRANAYEELKLELASKYRNDRVGYRIAKTDFINETLKLAKEEASL